MGVRLVRRAEGIAFRGIDVASLVPGLAKHKTADKLIDALDAPAGQGMIVRNKVRR